MSKKYGKIDRQTAALARWKKYLRFNLRPSQDGYILGQIYTLETKLFSTKKSKFVPFDQREETK